MPEAINPRRKVDLLQPILTGLVLLVVGYGANEVRGMNDRMQALERNVVRLETTIQLGMSDRFTGTEGRAVTARLVLCEKLGEKNESRLDTLEQWCAKHRGQSGD